VLIEHRIELCLLLPVALPFGFGSPEFCALRGAVLLVAGARDLLFVTSQIDDLAHHSGSGLQREMNFRNNSNRSDAGVGAATAF
jgi:hypothetical protein